MCFCVKGKKKLENSYMLRFGQGFEVVEILPVSTEQYGKCSPKSCFPSMSQTK